MIDSLGIEIYQIQSIATLLSNLFFFLVVTIIGLWFTYTRKNQITDLFLISVIWGGVGNIVSAAILLFIYIFVEQSGVITLSQFNLYLLPLEELMIHVVLILFFVRRKLVKSAQDAFVFGGGVAIGIGIVNSFVVLLEHVNPVEIEPYVYLVFVSAFACIAIFAKTLLNDVDRKKYIQIIFLSIVVIQISFAILPPIQLVMLSSLLLLFLYAQGYIKSFKGLFLWVVGVVTGIEVIYSVLVGQTGAISFLELYVNFLIDFLAFGLTFVILFIGAKKRKILISLMLGSVIVLIINIGLISTITKLNPDCYPICIGVKWNRKDLSELNLVNINLSGSDLRESNMKQAELQNSILVGANLEGADLSGVNLSGAKAVGTSFKRANLTGATVANMNLSGANFENANLTDVDFTTITETHYLAGINFSGAVMVGAILTTTVVGGRFVGAHLTGMVMNGVNLVGSDFSDADMSGVQLKEGNLNGAILAGVNLRGSSLINGSFRGVDFSSANLKGADLTGANLTGANLKGADLTGANLTDANLTDAKLNQFTNLSGTNLSGTNLEGTALAEIQGETRDQEFLVKGISYNRKTVWPENFIPPISTNQSVDSRGKYEGVEIKIAIVNDGQPEQYWREIGYDFQDLFGATLILDFISENDLARSGLSSNQEKMYDGYIIPLQKLSTYASQGLLLPLDNRLATNDLVVWDDILPVFRQNSSWENKNYLLPLRASYPLVYYRADIFGLYGYNPPNSWDELVTIMNTLEGSDWDGDNRSDYTFCSNVNQEVSFWSMSAPSLQSQGTGSGLFFDLGNGQPVVNDAFVNSLKLYQEIEGKEDTFFAPELAREQFLNGRCLMLIDDVSLMSLLPLYWQQFPDKVDQFGVVPMPGSTTILNSENQLVFCDVGDCAEGNKDINYAPFIVGGLGGGIDVRAKKEVQDAAYEFLSSISKLDAKQLERTFLLGGTYTPFRYTDYNDLSVLAQFQITGAQSNQIARYLHAAERTISNPNLSVGLMIPNQDQYYQTFNLYLSSYINEEIDAESMIRLFRESWQRLMDNYGRAVIQKEYRYSINLPK